MKNATIFLFVFSLFFTITSSAQHLGNGVMAEIGDVLSIVSADSAAIDEGPSGNGVVWDFSVLTPVNEPGVTTFVDPADTPHQDSFPDANLAAMIVTPFATTYTYYLKSGGALNVLGSVSPTSLTDMRSNPDLILHVPMNDSDVVTDEFEGFPTAEAVRCTIEVTKPCRSMLPGPWYCPVVRSVR